MNSYINALNSVFSCSKFFHSAMKVHNSRFNRCLSCRFGHETSQWAESANKALKPERMLVAFSLSNVVWDYCMKNFWHQKELGESVTTSFPPNIITFLKRVEEAASHMIVDACSREEVEVTDPEFGKQYLVKFSPMWWCTCGKFQDFLLPCKHEWRALTKLRLCHYDYVSDFYST